MPPFIYNEIMNFFHSEQLRYTPQDILSVFLSLYVVFRKSLSSRWKEKSEADGNTSACSFGYFTIARRRALKTFMETPHQVGGSKRHHYFVSMDDRGQATEGGPALLGDSGRRTSVRTRIPGEGCSPREPPPQPGGGYGGAVLGRARDEPFPSIRCRGVLSATRAVRAAPRGAADSRADAPASARPPEEDGAGVTRSARWGGQLSTSDSPGTCRFKGRGRSREAARSFWLPEPAPSAAARPRPLPEGAQGFGRLSADCRKLNLSP